MAGRPSYQIVGDLESTGYEVELNFSPTRNWNIRVNGAKSEAVESNIGQPWFAWTEARLPVWTGVVAKNGERDAQGQPVTWKTALLSPTVANSMTLEQYYNSTLVGNALAFMTASDGKVTGNGRSARANLITNYRFTSGRLGGFNAGGAVRWRAAPNIGYGTKRSASGSTVLDIDRPFDGKEELFCDVMLGYRGRIKAFNHLGFRAQLNVRNVLNRDDPVPVAAMTTGAVVRLATVEPRVIVFTFGVEF